MKLNDLLNEINKVDEREQKLEDKIDALQKEFNPIYRHNGLTFQRTELLELAQVWAKPLGYYDFSTSLYAEMQPTADALAVFKGAERLTYAGGDADETVESTSTIVYGPVGRHKFQRGVTNTELYTFFQFVCQVKDYITEFLDIDYNICPICGNPVHINALHNDGCQYCGYTLPEEDVVYDEHYNDTDYQSLQFEL